MDPNMRGKARLITLAELPPWLIKDDDEASLWIRRGGGEGLGLAQLLIKDDEFGRKEGDLGLQLSPSLIKGNLGGMTLQLERLSHPCRHPGGVGLL
jgi:hypothetical protein